LASGVLRLLGRSCRGLLGSLAHLILDALILRRLIHVILDLVVGVGHLLDLGLCISLRNLLGELLQLGAITLDPALEVTQ
jgi:hypothetical protein